ncbi:MAG: aldo/keto reductase [Proteobacteria bacterium]|nr:aldo/keto reductase [Pseudomonadota bacterium]
MIPKQPFGATGHDSTRIIFGAAAVFAVDQNAADRILEELLEAGINHIDVAASYGHAELRVGPWMREHRGDFFLATKTGERSYEGARDQIRASLERLQVDQIDLIQLHNLTDEEGWEQAFRADGALRACVEAREEGLVRFIGVTGHGTRVASMHLRSLERFPFDSVLLPYPFSMREQPAYAESFEKLLEVCAERRVAVQTIKAVARRRWGKDEKPTTTTWYHAFEDPEDIERAIHWALARPGIFVNTASDPGLMRTSLAAAASFTAEPSRDEMTSAWGRLDVQALFISGYEGVGRSAQ